MLIYNYKNDIKYDISIHEYFLTWLFTDEVLENHKVRFFKGRTESEVWKVEQEYELEKPGHKIWTPKERR